MMQLGSSGGGQATRAATGGGYGGGSSESRLAGGMAAATTTTRRPGGPLPPQQGTGGNSVMLSRSLPPPLTRDGQPQQPPQQSGGMMQQQQHRGPPPHPSAPSSMSMRAGPSAAGSHPQLQQQQQQQAARAQRMMPPPGGAAGGGGPAGASGATGPLPRALSAGPLPHSRLASMMMTAPVGGDARSDARPAGRPVVVTMGGGGHHVSSAHTTGGGGGGLHASMPPQQAGDPGFLMAGGRGRSGSSMQPMSAMPPPGGGGRAMMMMTGGRAIGGANMLPPAASSSMMAGGGASRSGGVGMARVLMGGGGGGQPAGGDFSGGGPPSDDLAAARSSGPRSRDQPSSTLVAGGVSSNVVDGLGGAATYPGGRFSGGMMMHPRPQRMQQLQPQLRDVRDVRGAELAPYSSEQQRGGGPEFGGSGGGYPSGAGVASSTGRPSSGSHFGGAPLAAHSGASGRQPSNMAGATLSGSAFDDGRFDGGAPSGMPQGGPLHRQGGMMMGGQRNVHPAVGQQQQQQQHMQLMAAMLRSSSSSSSSSSAPSGARMMMGVGGGGVQHERGPPLPATRAFGQAPGGPGVGPPERDMAGGGMLQMLPSRGGELALRDVRDGQLLRGDVRAMVSGGAGMMTMQQQQQGAAHLRDVRAANGGGGVMGATSGMSGAMMLRRPLGVAGSGSSPDELGGPFPAYPQQQHQSRHPFDLSTGDSAADRGGRLVPTRPGASLQFGGPVPPQFQQQRATYHQGGPMAARGGGPPSSGMVVGAGFVGGYGGGPYAAARGPQHMQMQQQIQQQHMPFGFAASAAGAPGLATSRSMSGAHHFQADERLQQVGPGRMVSGSGFGASGEDDYQLPDLAYDDARGRAMMMLEPATAAAADDSEEDSDEDDDDAALQAAADVAAGAAAAQPVLPPLVTTAPDGITQVPLRFASCALPLLGAAPVAEGGADEAGALGVPPEAFSAARLVLGELGIDCDAPALPAAPAPLPPTVTAHRVMSATEAVDSLGKATDRIVGTVEEALPAMRARLAELRAVYTRQREEAAEAERLRAAAAEEAAAEARRIEELAAAAKAEAEARRREAAAVAAAAGLMLPPLAAHSASSLDVDGDLHPTRLVRLVELQAGSITAPAAVAAALNLPPFAPAEGGSVAPTSDSALLPQHPLAEAASHVLTMLSSWRFHPSWATAVAQASRDASAVLAGAATLAVASPSFSPAPVGGISLDAYLQRTASDRLWGAIGTCLHRLTVSPVDASDLAAPQAVAVISFDDAEAALARPASALQSHPLGRPSSATALPPETALADAAVEPPAAGIEAADSPRQLVVRVCGPLPHRLLRPLPDGDLTAVGVAVPTSLEAPLAIFRLPLALLRPTLLPPSAGAVETSDGAALPPSVDYISIVVATSVDAMAGFCAHAAEAAVASHPRLRCKARMRQLAGGGEGAAAVSPFIHWQPYGFIPGSGKVATAVAADAEAACMSLPNPLPTSVAVAQLTARALLAHRSAWGALADAAALGVLGNRGRAALSHVDMLRQRPLYSLPATVVSGTDMQLGVSAHSASAVSDPSLGAAHACLSPTPVPVLLAVPFKVAGKYALGNTANDTGAPRAPTTAGFVPATEEDSDAVPADASSAHTTRRSLRTALLRRLDSSGPAAVISVPVPFRVISNVDGGDDVAAERQPSLLPASTSFALLRALRHRYSRCVSDALGPLGQRGCASPAAAALDLPRLAATAGPLLTAWPALAMSAATADGYVRGALGLSSQLHASLRGAVAAVLARRAAVRTAHQRALAAEYARAYREWKRRNWTWERSRRARIADARSVHPSLAGAMGAGAGGGAADGATGVSSSEVMLSLAASPKFDSAGGRTGRRAAAVAAAAAITATSDSGGGGRGASSASSHDVVGSAPSSSSGAAGWAGVAMFNPDAETQIDGDLASDSEAEAEGADALFASTSGGAAAVRSEWELQQRLGELADKERRAVGRMYTLCPVPDVLADTSLRQHTARLRFDGNARLTTDGAPALCSHLPARVPCGSASRTLLPSALQLVAPTPAAGVAASVSELAESRGGRTRALLLAGGRSHDEPMQAAGAHMELDSGGDAPPGATAAHTVALPSSAAPPHTVVDDSQLLLPAESLALALAGMRISHADDAGAPGAAANDAPTRALWFGGCNCAVAVELAVRGGCVWSDAEKLIFMDKFMQFPKDFTRIAGFLPNKTPNDCVAFYYDSKQVAGYKHRLKAVSNQQRRRGPRNGWLQAVGAVRDVGVPVHADVARGLSAGHKVVSAVGGRHGVSDIGYSRLFKHPGPYARVPALHRFATLPLPLTPGPGGAAASAMVAAGAAKSAAATAAPPRNEYMYGYGLGSQALPWGARFSMVLAEAASADFHAQDSSAISALSTGGGEGPDPLTIMPSESAAAAGAGSGIGGSLVRVYAAADALTRSEAKKLGSELRGGAASSTDAGVGGLGASSSASLQAHDTRTALRVLSRAGFALLSHDAAAIAPPSPLPPAGSSLGSIGSGAGGAGIGTSFPPPPGGLFGVSLILAHLLSESLLVAAAAATPTAPPVAVAAVSSSGSGDVHLHSEPLTPGAGGSGIDDGGSAAAPAAAAPVGAAAAEPTPTGGAPPAPLLVPALVSTLAPLLVAFIGAHAPSALLTPRVTAGSGESAASTPPALVALAAGPISSAASASLHRRILAALAPLWRRIVLVPTDCGTSSGHEGGAARVSGFAWRLATVARAAVASDGEAGRVRLAGGATASRRHAVSSVATQAAVAAAPSSPLVALVVRLLLCPPVAAVTSPALRDALLACALQVAACHPPSMAAAAAAPTQQPRSPPLPPPPAVVVELLEYLLATASDPAAAAAEKAAAKRLRKEVGSGKADPRASPKAGSAAAVLSPTFSTASGGAAAASSSASSATRSLHGFAPLAEFAHVISSSGTTTASAGGRPASSPTSAASPAAGNAPVAIPLATLRFFEPLEAVATYAGHGDVPQPKAHHRHQQQQQQYPQPPPGDEGEEGEEGDVVMGGADDEERGGAAAGSGPCLVGVPLHGRSAWWAASAVASRRLDAFMLPPVMAAPTAGAPAFAAGVDGAGDADAPSLAARPAKRDRSSRGVVVVSDDEGDDGNGHTAEGGSGADQAARGRAAALASSEPEAAGASGASSAGGASGKVHWTLADKERLVAGMRTHRRNWARISSSVFGGARSSKQCYGWFAKHKTSVPGLADLADGRPSVLDDPASTVAGVLAAAAASRRAALAAGGGSDDTAAAVAASASAQSSEPTAASVSGPRLAADDAAPLAGPEAAALTGALLESSDTAMSGGGGGGGGDGGLASPSAAGGGQAAAHRVNGDLSVQEGGEEEEDVVDEEADEDEDVGAEEGEGAGSSGDDSSSTDSSDSDSSSSSEADADAVDADALVVGSDAAFVAAQAAGVYVDYHGNLIDPTGARVEGDDGEVVEGGYYVDEYRQVEDGGVPVMDDGTSNAQQQQQQQQQYLASYAHHHHHHEEGQGEQEQGEGQGLASWAAHAGEDDDQQAQPQAHDHMMGGYGGEHIQDDDEGRHPTGDPGGEVEVAGGGGGYGGDWQGGADGPQYDDLHGGGNGGDDGGGDGGDDGAGDVDGGDDGGGAGSGDDGEGGGDDLDGDAHPPRKLRRVEGGGGEVGVAAFGSLGGVAFAHYDAGQGQEQPAEEEGEGEGGL